MFNPYWEFFLQLGFQNTVDFYFYFETSIQNHSPVTHFTGFPCPQYILSQPDLVELPRKKANYITKYPNGPLPSLNLLTHSPTLSPGSHVLSLLPPQPCLEAPQARPTTPFLGSVQPWPHLPLELIKGGGQLPAVQAANRPSLLPAV